MGRLIKIVVGVVILAAVLFFIRTNYLLVRPGSAEDLSKMVSVEEKPEAGEEEGHFYLVTVSQQPANTLLLVYGFLNPEIDLQHVHNVIPPGMTSEQYRELMDSWMDESQMLAKVIALRRAGYSVEVVSEGVEVVKLMKDSPAQGVLEPGDLITAVDDRPVKFADEVVSLVQERSIGEPVTLTLKRGEELFDAVVFTTSHTEEQGKAALRMYIRTLKWHAQLPVDISIETGPIAGPSAGLMFVLEIMNQLLPGDLTAGYQIAGTGTININESVGPIGGVKQKVIAAEKAGAQYFLVPESNYDIAAEAARDINVVPVKNLDEVLRFLRSIGADTAAVTRWFTAA